MTTEFFYSNKSRKDGVSVYCIQCSKIYYSTDKRKEYDRERSKVRSKTNEYKEYQVQYQMKVNKEKYNNDVTFRINKRMRNTINKYIKRKQKTTNEIIGCSSTELIEHLEKQFKVGMSWDNYGQEGWVIDHIYPLSKAKSEDELYRLNHYTNLQPLWWYDNLMKSDKLPEEMINDFH
jgi:hypothetical protein